MPSSKPRVGPRLAISVGNWGGSSLTPRGADGVFQAERVASLPPQLPTEIANRGPTLGLLDGIDDLLFGES